MAETQTVCERSANGDHSLNQSVLNTLHYYYVDKYPCPLAEEDPDLFVFLRTYRDYHGGLDEENMHRVRTLYFDRFDLSESLPHFVARQYDLLIKEGKIQGPGDA